MVCNEKATKAMRLVNLDIGVGNNDVQLDRNYMKSASSFSTVREKPVIRIKRLGFYRERGKLKAASLPKYYDGQKEIEKDKANKVMQLITGRIDVPVSELY